MINGIGGSATPVHGGTIGTQLQTNAVLTLGATQFLSSQTVASGKPKAFLNWVLFDEQFKLVSTSSSVDPVGDDDVFKLHVIDGILMNKSGYLYVYVSNETPNIHVFFDNLQVTHVKGPVVEETHYYPFGLTMAGISSKRAGGVQNKNKFNGANELQRAEFSDGNGLELYDAVHRMYDPQIGRFWQVDELAEANWEMSTYNFASNNPISFNDPLGLTDEDPASNLYKEKTLPVVVIHSVRKLNHYQMQSLYWDLRKSGVGFDNVKNNVLKERLQRWDGVQRHMEKVHAMSREFDMAVLEAGSLFVPLGWITKLKYVKTAVELIKIRRGVVAAEVAISKVVAATKTILKPLGLGSTGRTTAANLVEQMAMKDAMANPELGRRIMEGMKDSRWMDWTKMQYSVETENGVKAVVHYVGKWENGVLKAVDDFKFK